MRENLRRVLFYTCYLEPRVIRWMVWERCEERERVQGWGVRARHNSALWGDCQLWSRPEVGPGPALENVVRFTAKP